MTTAYSTLMGLAEPVQGELSGTWGDTVNKGITEYLDVALAGTQTISGSQTAVTLSLTNGNASATNIAQAGTGTTGSAQYAVINCTGNPASLLTVTVPASSRQYIVLNATSTSQSVKIVGVGPTTGVTIASGEKAVVAWSGSDFVKVASSTALSGTVPVSSGGTGLTSVTASYVPYGNGTSPLSTSANFQFDGTVQRVGSNALLGGTTNPVAGFTGGTNNYIQTYIYNATNGASSSADFVAYANNSTDAHGWADMGFTSASYADATYTVTGPNEAYLFGSALNSSYTGNLVYATDSTGSANAHQWYVGGFTQAKGAWKMQLTSTGLQLANALAVAYGGTGQTSYTDGQLLIGNSTGNTLTKATLTAGSGVSITNGGGSITIAATGSGGTVTSVGLTMPTGFSVTGSPVTGSGTLAVSTSLSGMLKGTGSAFTTGTAGTDYVAPGTATTFTATQTLNGSSSTLGAVLLNSAETTTVSATAATGTIAYYPSSQSVLYYTSNAAANWTVNLTFSAGTTMNTAMSTGQSMTMAFLVTQGATAYYNNVVQVDGTTTGVTTIWQGGAPTKGNASGVDVYTYTVIKTGSATFTVLASQVQFK